MKKVFSILSLIGLFFSACGQDTIRLEQGDTTSWNPEHAGFGWSYGENSNFAYVVGKQKPERGVHQIYCNGHHVAEVTYISSKEYLICTFGPDSSGNVYQIEYYPYFKIRYAGTDSSRYIKDIFVYMKDLRIEPWQEPGLLEMYHSGKKSQLIYIRRGRMSHNISMMRAE